MGGRRTKGVIHSVLRRWTDWEEWKLWVSGLLGVFKRTYEEKKPGLIMIQIDGLSFADFNEHVSGGKAGFLKKIIKSRGYILRTLYSGLPSLTPCAQSELFYGIRGSSRDFPYRASENGPVFTMYSPRAASIMEKRLSGIAEGTLEGGASYGNIFAGGADAASYGLSHSRWSHGTSLLGVRKLLFFFFTYLYGLLKTSLLFLVSLASEIPHLLSGEISVSGIIRGLEMIISRSVTAVLVKDLITFSVINDILGGVPVIHANFMGYDGQAHRTGRNSVFSGWALSGISRSIHRIYRKAHKFKKREYDVWIYSDHGQQEYRKGRKRRKVAGLIREIKKVIETADLYSFDREKESSGSRFDGGSVLQSLFLNLVGGQTKQSSESYVLNMIGTMGFIYLSDRNPGSIIDGLSEKLSSLEGVRIAAYHEGSKTAAWKKGKKYTLPEDAEKVFGDIPFMEDIVSDFMNICSHPETGRIVISGWDSSEDIPMAYERGAHSGPGRYETQAFVLLPSKVNIYPENGCYLRHGDLRKKARELMGHKPDPDKNRFISTGKIRLMTYNINSCIGMDRKISIERIARVIKRYDPDIVALQEVDVLRSRTGDSDQAKQIGRYLDMFYRYHPSMRLAEEKFGNVILSKYPMRVVKTGKLSGLPEKLDVPPRGAIWVEIDLESTKLQVINTHLGLIRTERRKQVSDLVSEIWAGRIKKDAPLIICGDFNMTYGSKQMKPLRKRFRDVQVGKGRRPRATWFSRLPWRRIDHIMVSRDIGVSNVDVPRTRLDKVASDHLPIIADLDLSE